MAVDTKARAYHWYALPEESECVIRFLFTPENDVFVSSMTPGTMELQARKDLVVTGEWETQKKVFEDLPWAVAQNVARAEGFAVEVPVYE